VKQDRAPESVTTHAMRFRTVLRPFFAEREGLW